MVDFLFVDEPVIDEASWDKAMTHDVGGAKLLDEVIAAFEHVPWDAEALQGRVEAHRRRARREVRQGRRPGAGRRHRPHRRPAAVRVARAARPRRDAAPAARRRRQRVGL